MITITDQALETDIPDFFRLENLIDSGWTFKMVLDAYKNSTSKFLKAKFNDETVGYINYSVIIDEVEINSVAVSHKHRRMGIAKMLIAALEKECLAQNVFSIFLEVNENNLAAIKLYQKCGFEFLSERKNYYGQDSAHIYKKQLK